jgi:hypothetical protein
LNRILCFCSSFGKRKNEKLSSAKNVIAATIRSLQQEYLGLPKIFFICLVIAYVTTGLQRALQIRQGKLFRRTAGSTNHYFNVVIDKKLLCTIEHARFVAIVVLPVPPLPLAITIFILKLFLVSIDLIQIQVLNLLQIYSLKPYIYSCFHYYFVD